MPNRTFSCYLATGVVLLLFVTGCTGSAPTETRTPPQDNAEVTLSEEVLNWIKKGSKVGAVKTHQKEAGLSLEDAKKQVEDVMERDGLVLGGQQ